MDISHRLKTVIEAVAGNPENLEYKNRFMNTVSFVALIMSLYGTILNIAMGLNSYLILTSVFTFLIFTFTYILSRFFSRSNLAYWIFSISAPVLLSMLWFENGGTKGPIIFIYFVYFVFIMLEWDGRVRGIFIAVIVLNLFLLYFLEYLFPYLIVPYRTEKSRMIDLISGLILFMIFAGMVIRNSKHNFILERQKAEQSDKLKSTFLANMSHEIRTPMNSIVGFSKLLSRDLPVEKRDEFIQIIDESGKYLLKLIDDIIDISRIESDTIQIKKSSCNLYKLFQKLNASFEQTIRKYGKNELILSFPYVKLEYAVLTDEVRLEQILSNLIVNAIKFTEKGSIIVGLEITGNFLQFSVRDMGIGIKPEHLDKIFTQFFKLEDDSLKSIQRGTGIGLYLSKKLAGLLGGRIWVESTYGSGSTFFFTIPRVEMMYRSTHANKQIIQPDAYDWHMKTVLIAEDENTNYVLLEELLNITGIVLHRAKNGKEAVKMCMRNHYDLVLMDIRMPEINGYDATAAIKSRTPSLPVIALTALAMEGDRQKCLEAGCDDYIIKPVDEDLLLLKMSVILE
jgi:signal transduction histidine kinase/CheY-like chemotaxis protein